MLDIAVGAAPAHVVTVTSDTQSFDSTAMAMPALTGAQAGDYGLLLVVSYNNATAPTTPTGWTRVSDADGENFSTDDVTSKVWAYKKASLAAGDISGLSVAKPGSAYYAGILGVYRSVVTLRDSKVDEFQDTADSGTFKATTAVNVAALSKVVTMGALFVGGGNPSLAGSSTRALGTIIFAGNAIRHFSFDLDVDANAAYSHNIAFTEFGATRRDAFYTFVLEPAPVLGASSGSIAACCC